MAKLKFETLKNYLRPFAPKRLLALWHLAQAVGASVFYQFPGRKIKVIGITGTNGKTTTAYLLDSILREAGFRVALSTTIANAINDETQKNMDKMTTSSPWALNKFLHQALRANCQIAIMEVTSHALSQRRVWGIPFWAVAFTNITHDHLDYHQTFESYLAQKLKLFANHPKVAVSNLDDKLGATFLAQPAFKKYGVSVDPARQSASGKKRSLQPNVFARKLNYRFNQTDFVLVSPQGQVAVSLQLPGKFNVTNALIASALAQGMGVSLAHIRAGLEALRKIRGRLEQIRMGQPFEIIIDYAHTPDAFEKVLQTLRQIYPRRRLVHVFGATGARDKTKRPILGKIASKYASVIILTDEDPYWEEPSAIISEVYQGIRKAKRQKVFRILSRKKAIAKALSLARRGDVVLITGKGHEEIMAVKAPEKGPKGFRLIPFSDRKIVFEALSKLGYTTRVSE